MATKQEKYTCPHCEAELQAFELPEAGGWDLTYHLACFNNDCPYYRRGWDWMLNHYNAKVSYRYRLDPKSGKDSPIAVWSETALVDRIIRKDVTPATKKLQTKAVKPAKKKPQKKDVEPAKKKPRKQDLESAKKKQKKTKRSVKPKRRTK